MQATIGLMQYGAGRESPLYFGMEHRHFDNAVENYTNRNRLAGLIEMTFPLVLGLLIYSLGRVRNRRGGTASRASFLGSRRGQATLIYASLAGLLILCVIFTRSRTGFGLMILGVILVTSIFALRIGGDNVFGSVGTLVTLGIGLAVTIGLISVLDRLLIHELVDYNLHTLANQVFFAFLLGICFRTGGSEEEVSSRRRRRTPDLGAEPKSLPSVASIRPVEVPPDQIRNPFLDDSQMIARVPRTSDRVFPPEHHTSRRA